MMTVDAQGIYYRMLNRRIREQCAMGTPELVITNVMGQRYIGGGINGSTNIKIYGTPGQDLGAFMNGLTLEVFGNAQDGVANTMNAGKIIVHGKAGEIPGHSMRGGKVFIRDDVEYRAAIHMKEYEGQVPWVIIGGTAKDYCGEYMAGGRVVVLNIANRPGSPVGYSVGTGIHGGAIYVRGAIEPFQLGRGAIVASLDDDDVAFLKGALEEYSRDLSINLGNITFYEFVKVTKKGHRPFANLYTPAMNIKTTQPKHINLTPPCAYNCPTGIPTSVYLNLIKEGKIREAQALMDEYTPFRMSVCGTVCPAPCMTGCSRNMIDGPVEIQKIAREYYPEFPPEPAKKKRRELVSVIGAGPAGLSAAWQLARRGYRVAVYDSADDVGGKVRKAIPRERLADELLDRDIERIKTYPIEWKLRTPITGALFSELYAMSDAVVVATGAQVPRRIPYPGGERIISGLTFLTDIIEGRPMDLSGKEVAVIGAGNVGMDIACESWRLGAKKVTAIDIAKPLAFGKELEMARRLGTEIVWPKTIERLDERRVVFSDGTSLKADVVFFSIGELPDAGFLGDAVLRDERGYLVTAEHSFRSNDPKVYGCGDIIRPGLVTDAIGTGRLAAMEVHANLTGGTFVYPAKSLVPRRRIQTVYFGGETREIDRCISCGTCIFCDRCIDACPQDALSRNGEVFSVDPARCTGCYTCVNVCPRGVLQTDDVAEFVLDELDNTG
ncbi:MAG TPA: FAD-dependent oxidoreductase [Spirochaetota bacterium]|nr:FAD-dependent oxidoreductase [Spirochaetota bacterium]HNT10019.1 FAD-dependent oxidoreductase [Spirochaetota bacterium]